MPGGYILADAVKLSHLAKILKSRRTSCDPDRSMEVELDETHSTVLRSLFWRRWTWRFCSLLTAWLLTAGITLSAPRRRRLLPSPQFDALHVRNGDQRPAERTRRNLRVTDEIQSIKGPTKESHTLKGIAWAQQLRRDTALLDSEKVYGLLKYYASFTAYVIDSKDRGTTTPLPLVRPLGERDIITIPLLIIIGAQKGGTTSLRTNLLKHPLVSGMQKEIHFFDMPLDKYPKSGRWMGDGNEQPLSPGMIGYTLTEYGRALSSRGMPENSTVDTSPPLHPGVVVESSPRYIFHPLVPYRMKMVMPNVKMVVLLRDPVERYFSQLRMVLCKKDLGRSNSDLGLYKGDSKFHKPSQLEEYLAEAEMHYKPYQPICQGVGATAEDLWLCYRRMESHNPLFRGLYAEQLERWFRVYDKSQIMIVNSAELFGSFSYTLSQVADFAGLPPHRFKYDPRKSHSACSGKRFNRGGLYSQLDSDREALREWYRPHNERLFRLIGRDFGWNNPQTDDPEAGKGGGREEHMAVGLKKPEG